MIDVYQASYDGGQRPVIDVIKDHPSSCGERAWAMVEPAKRLLKAARRAGLPVIYSTGDTRSQADRGRPTNRQVMTDTDNAYEILPRALTTLRANASASTPPGVRRASRSGRW